MTILFFSFQHQCGPVRIIDLQTVNLFLLIILCDKNGFLIDPSVSAISRIIGIENDLIIPGFRNDKIIIRNGMINMKVEDEDQVIFCEDEGFVPVIQVKLGSVFLV